MGTTTKAGKKTREKLPPKQKRCCDCGEIKHKLKAFKPRWGRCEKHRDQGKPFSEKCKGCQAVRNGNIRQPRCIDCDAKRTKKEKPVAAPVAAAAGSKKKGKKGKAQQPATPVEVPAPASATPPVAPQPAQPEQPAPVAQTAPAPASEALAAVANLLGESEPSGSEVPATSPFDQGALADDAGALNLDDETTAPEVIDPLPAMPAGAPSGGSSVPSKPATGVFRGPPAQGPRLAVRGSKGCSQGRHYAQANLTEIKRILAALTTREERVAAAERKLADANGRFRLVIAGLKKTNLPSDEIVEDARYKTAKARRDHEIARVQNAKEWRDFTSQRLRLYLDHALTTTPYVTRKCKTCDSGVIVGKDGTVAPCSECKGTKTVRQENPNPFAKAAVPILKHISRVLEEAELCFKIRARTEDSEAAFEKLLAENQGLVRKFGNPIQTALEADDAEQGAIMGLFDGAKRFDPTRPTHIFCPRCQYERKLNNDDYDQDKLRTHQKCPKCHLEKMMLGTSTATYRTYAWNWTKRNSRARKDVEKRPGLLHPSIDDPHLGGKSLEDGSVADQVTMVGGRIAMASGGGGHDSDSIGTAAMDLLPAIESLEDDQQRQVLECILENMQPGEIAAKLGISTRQVAKIKDAAFVAMRRKLAGYLEV